MQYCRCDKLRSNSNVNLNFAAANSEKNNGRWYANCRKYPNSKNCGYFRWLDEAVIDLSVLKKIGTLDDFYYLINI